MPKISYLDSSKALFDDTEVTQEQIENKVAEIEALLRGMIDDDNLLSYNNDFEPIPIPPSNIVDLPGETRFVDNSIKFFAHTASKQDKVVEDLFERLIEIMEARPSFNLVNGLGSKEILITTEADKYKSETKSLDIEIPFNYSVMTWKELWPYILENNPKISISANPSSSSEEDKYILSDTPFTTLSGFLDELDLKGDDLVTEISFDLEETHSFGYYITDVQKENLINIFVSVTPEDNSVERSFKFVPSFLCRVNP